MRRILKITAAFLAVLFATFVYFDLVHWFDVRVLAHGEKNEEIVQRQRGIGITRALTGLIAFTPGGVKYSGQNRIEMRLANGHTAIYQFGEGYNCIRAEYLNDKIALTGVMYGEGPDTVVFDRATGNEILEVDDAVLSVIKGRPTTYSCG